MNTAEEIKTDIIDEDPMHWATNATMDFTMFLTSGLCDLTKESADLIVALYETLIKLDELNAKYKNQTSGE